MGLDGWAAAEYVRRGWWGALLSPPFVEWMMGLALGHVTGAPGVSRSALLRVLGNGVVPPQALLAVEFLLTRLLEGWSARVAAGTSAVAVAAS